MDYNSVCEIIDKIDTESDAPLDLIVNSALSGNYYTDKLPPRSEAAVLLLDWYMSGSNAFTGDETDELTSGVGDFYRICPKDKFKAAEKLLKQDGYHDVAALIKEGLKGVDRALKGDYIEWMESVQNMFDLWMEFNAPRFHKLIKSWVKSESAELKKFFASTDIKLADAFMKSANVLRDWRDNDAALALYMTAADMGDPEAMLLISEYYSQLKNDVKTAFEWCEKAAICGSADAQLRLSYMYRDKNDKKSEQKWYKLAAENGQPYALFLVGKMYRDGDGVKKDPSLAVECFRKAADGGVLDAYGALAPMYENGEGAERDRSRAIEYYSIAAVLGSPTARERLREFPDMTDYMAKSDELERLARGGDAYATYALGCIAEYREDEDTSEEYYRKAAELWRKKVEEGDADAMVLLGLCYNLEKGVEEDQATAYRLFERAESLGDPDGTYQIGSLYAGGEGVKYSPKTANKYFQKAADAGVVQAMLDLGNNYLDGTGIKQDTAMARYWLTRAAEGDSDTCANRCLSDICEKAGDREKAREWLVTAAEKGDRSAQVMLARRMFADKPDISARIDRAARSYEYTDFYDIIFDRIKNDLPFRNDRITLVK